MKKKSAFTFIEVMIAIVIFSIGILAVLNLVTNNLKSMDRNNLKLQATLLAKEWIELVYNLRDSNLEKQLSWNCLMDPEMYSWDAQQLSSKIWRWNQSDFENVICKWYFGTGNFLKIWFDFDLYMFHENFDISDDFFVNYENSNLSYFENDKDLFWYWYPSIDTGTKTNFARYVLFKSVKEWDKILPLDKIMKIESHVLYLKWSTTGEVVFESFIWNY